MSVSRRLVAAALRELAWRSGYSARRLRAPGGRWVLMVHGVGEGELSPQAFAAGVAWLKRNFRIVSLGRMLEDLEAGRGASSGGELAITFDDGLRNQALQAYPVLRELQVPATIFVCPGLIDSGAWLWNHEARARLGRLSQAQREEFAARADGSQFSADAIVEAMKALPAARRRDLQEQLRLATPDFVATAAEREASDPMSWEQLAGLDPGLITIGSHTVSHPILPGLDDAELEFEIRASREMLEQRLGREIDLFCYPNGASDARAQRLVAKVYRAAVTTRKARVPVDVDTQAIPRVAMEASCPLLAWRMLRVGS